MWVSDTGTPVSSTDGDDAQFGEDHGSTDGSCDFLGAFDTETDMTIRITDDDEGLETSSLTSACLFLYGANLRSQNNSKQEKYLHNFILEFRKEIIDYLVLLNGQGM